MSVSGLISLCDSLSLSHWCIFLVYAWLVCPTLWCTFLWVMNFCFVLFHIAVFARMKNWRKKLIRIWKICTWYYVQLHPSFPLIVFSSFLPSILLSFVSFVVCLFLFKLLHSFCFMPWKSEEIICKSVGTLPCRSSTLRSCSQSIRRGCHMTPIAFRAHAPMQIWQSRSRIDWLIPIITV